MNVTSRDSTVTRLRTEFRNRNIFNGCILKDHIENTSTFKHCSNGHDYFYVCSFTCGYVTRGVACTVDGELKAIDAIWQSEV